MFYFLLSLLASPLLYALIAIRKQKISLLQQAKEETIQRIVVIQTAKIGDLVCTTPVFKELRRKYPEAYIAAAINPVAIGVLKNNPNINEIIPVASKNYKGLTGKLKLAGIFRAKNFDVALILLPNLQNTLAVFWGLIPWRISVYPENAGLTFRLCSIFNSHLEAHKPGELVSQTYLKALEPLEIKATNSLPEVFNSPEAEKGLDLFWQQAEIKEEVPLIGISISCGNKLKEWGQEKFARLADLILENYSAEIIFIGADADKTAATQIQNLMQKKTINSCGGFALENLPALLKKLTLFIGVDTGVAYMAAAVGTPLINIAGPCNMQDQRPQGAKCKIIQKELPCIPCSHNFSVPTQCKQGNRECLEKISVNEVMQAIETQLNK